MILVVQNTDSMGSICGFIRGTKGTASWHHSLMWIMHYIGRIPVTPDPSDLPYSHLIVGSPHPDWLPIGWWGPSNMIQAHLFSLVSTWFLGSSSYLSWQTVSSGHSSLVSLLLLSLLCCVRLVPAIACLQNSPFIEFPRKRQVSASVFIYAPQFWKSRISFIQGFS